MRMPTANVVKARVRGDAIEPRREGQRGVVLVERAICPDECLLSAVVGRVGVARNTQCDVVHAASVPFDDDRVGVGVTGEARPYDVLVGPGQPSLRYTARTPPGHSLYPLVLRGVSRILGPLHGPHLARPRLFSHARPRRDRADGPARPQI